MLYATTTTAPVFGLRREIDRLFDSAFTHGKAAWSEWTPAVEIRETDQELSFVVELPGMTLDQIELSAVNGILTIRGERLEEGNNGETNLYLLAERYYGSFLRRFELPQGVDVEKIEADMQNGILQVRIPKAALPQPKRIRISAGTHVNANKNAPRAVGHGDSRPNSTKKLAAAR
jgi:HSP20 family protein